MDAIHDEFTGLLAALQQATDATLPERLAALAEHLHAHFAAEDGWMRDSDFPAGACHIDEHAAVLASVQGVQLRLAEGDAAAARRLTQALADWFPAHAQHLDSALAHWLCKRRLGGKPVVFHPRQQVSVTPTGAT